jgi:hypothetical protein
VIHVKSSRPLLSAAPVFAAEQVARADANGPGELTQRGDGDIFEIQGTFNGSTIYAARPRESAQAESLHGLRNRANVV